jgi:hypothetical protein
MEDWRLTNQEKYLQNKSLMFSRWTQRHERNDHDHCEFCFAKFGNFEESLHEGYCTEDRYRWICKDCFNDFKDRFNWTVIE